MIFNPFYGYAAALFIGASSSWYVQGLRWGNDIAKRDTETANAIASNVSAINTQLILSRSQTEELRLKYAQYKQGKENETDALKRAVANGAKRLRIAGNCPAPVHADGTVSGGTGSGDPELDATARFNYYALRDGISRQYALLQFCRAELRKRSSP